ncbi:hypothetical protein M8J75_004918 [Diaphorina citri]|nr:hypothetical protein M8J75_004918 [Diaphorina citri]
MNQFNNKDLTKIRNEPAALGVQPTYLFELGFQQPPAHCYSFQQPATQPATQPTTRLMSFDLFTHAYHEQLNCE